MTEPKISQAFVDRFMVAVAILCVLAGLWFNRVHLLTWTMNHRWQVAVIAAALLGGGVALVSKLREDRMGNEYRMLLEMGHSRRNARRIALVNAVKDDEAKSCMTYETDQVNQAIVHSRQDLVLVIAHLDEMTSSLRVMNRWLAALTMLIGILLLVLM